MVQTSASPEALPSGPLQGVRVLEIARGRPARIAGMLLADLGADVVRMVDPDAPTGTPTPESVCWDRGKRLLPAPRAAATELARDADVLLIDESPSSIAASGCDSESLRPLHPGLAHVWMPPYGERGEWRDLPEDPLLLAALGGLAVFYPADDDSPVAPVTTGLTHLHAAMGAAAAVAGLVGRQRHGSVPPCVVTGLHAAAAVMGPALAELDGGGSAPARSSTGAPNWRIYQCADGRRLFLGALTPDIFFRALEVLGRLDVLALPEVAGDVQAVMDPRRGGAAVAAELEPILAAHSSDEWLARFAEARVPCATVQTRAEWMDSAVVRDNGIRVDLPHPDLGTVTMPSVPVTLSETPGSVRGFAQRLPGDGPLAWHAPVTPGRRAEGSNVPPPALPLDGVTVLDASSFMAGPVVSALLADHGADVVKLEPPGGETYRFYALSFLAINQRKKGIMVDLKEPEGLAALHTVLGRTDVLVENMRPKALAELGLGGGAPTRFPRLVHCTVSAFGRAEAFADLPGFDPLVQVLNGSAVAQGGADSPAFCPAPLNDATTGALGALGCLAALYHRGEGDGEDDCRGRGQRVWVSLAETSTFGQSGEFTTWRGSPEPPQGHPLFRGPGDGRRYYECADGWVAVAAVGTHQHARMAAALGIANLHDAAGVLRTHTVQSATVLLAQHGVTACRVVPRHRPLHDRFLEDNGFSHLVDLPPDHVARVVARTSRWPDAPQVRASRYFAPGEHNSTVLADAGAETNQQGEGDRP